MPIFPWPVEQRLPGLTRLFVFASVKRDEAAKIVGKFPRQTVSHCCALQSRTGHFLFFGFRFPLLVLMPVIQLLPMLLKLFPFCAVLLQYFFALARQGFDFPQGDIQIGQIGFSTLLIKTVRSGDSQERWCCQFDPLKFAKKIGCRRREHRAIAAIEQCVRKIRSAGYQSGDAKPCCQRNRPNPTVF